MKYFLILLTVHTISATTYSQTAEDSVKAAVNKMFTGMKNADATLMKNSFADSAILQTIARDKDGSMWLKMKARQISLILSVNFHLVLPMNVSPSKQ